jgi:hypothetical protein
VSKLTITESGQASVFELFEDEVTIGRGASNAIQVSDGHASKVHAVVRRIHGKAKLVDLESKNGTKVNGEFKNQRWLEDGDTISIGEASIVFEAGEPVAVGRGGGARAATAVSGAAVAAASGAPARPMPTVRSGADRERVRTRRHRDDDDRDDGDDEGPRVPKRNDNSAAIAMIVGFGIVGLVALAFFLASKSTAGSNAGALRQAKVMWGRAQTEADRQAAISFLEQNSDPTDEDAYKSVKDELESWKAQMGTFAVAAQNGEASKIYGKIDFDRIEMHKGVHSKESLTARLQQFAQTYMGTATVHSYLHDPFPPHNKMRALSGEDAASAAMLKIFKAWDTLQNETLTVNQRTPRDDEIRAMLVKFRSDFPKSLVTDEIDRSSMPPFPDFRRLLGR